MSLNDLMVIPNILDAKRILCVQPHPDDMDISFGGTLLKLANTGAHITYLTVTDGSAGTVFQRPKKELAEIRRYEQEQAGKIIGVKEYIWLNYDDALRLPEDALQDDIIRAIRTYNPDTVITTDPWLPYEAHPAHRTVGLCASAAIIFSSLGNMGPADTGESIHNITRAVFTFTAKPNTYVDISDTWQQKTLAIQAHSSQFPPETFEFYQEYFNWKATEYGHLIQCEKAEAVKVLTPMQLHCNVDIDRF